MPRLAEDMRRRGVRPGIWMRPLYTTAALAEGRVGGTSGGHARSQRAGRDRAGAAGCAAAAGWGFELIKHDYSTYDLLGRWGFALNAEVTSGEWHSRTRRAPPPRSCWRSTSDSPGGGRRAADRLQHVRAPGGRVARIAAHWGRHQRADFDRTRAWASTRWRFAGRSTAPSSPRTRTALPSRRSCLGPGRAMAGLVARSGTPLFVSADPRATGPSKNAPWRGRSCRHPRRSRRRAARLAGDHYAGALALRANVEYDWSARGCSPFVK